MKQVAILPEVIDQIVVDTSGAQPRYIAVSHTKKHMQISPLAYTLLEKVQAGDSFTAIAQALNGDGKRALTAEEVQAAYTRVVEKIGRIGGEEETKPRDFWFKIPLISAANVQEIAGKLMFLFHPLVAFLALTSICLLAAYAIVHGLTSSVWDQPIMVIPAYLLFLVSLFAHEFGHASACMKGGVRPSEIGGAVYLFFPVFYSDVSASWQLRRWQKVRVDIGGIYFQLCVGGIYLLLFIVTGQAVFQWATYMLVSSCLLSLNPLMKFDGYWVLADMLDVSNLFKQPLYLLTYMYNAMRGRKQVALRWSRAVCIAILLYGLCRAILWTYLVIVFLPFLYHAAINYPALLGGIIAHLPHEGGEQLMADLQELVTNGLVIVLYGGGFYRICLPFLKKLFAVLKPFPRLSSSAERAGM